jgi:hypothetical protein
VRVAAELDYGGGVSRVVSGCAWCDLMDFGTTWDSLRQCMAVEQGCVAAAVCEVHGKT